NHRRGLPKSVCCHCRTCRITAQTVSRDVCRLTALSAAVRKNRIDALEVVAALDAQAFSASRRESPTARLYSTDAGNRDDCDPRVSRAGALVHELAVRPRGGATLAK